MTILTYLKLKSVHFYFFSLQRSLWQGLVENLLIVMLELPLSSRDYTSTLVASRLWLLTKEFDKINGTNSLKTSESLGYRFVTVLPDWAIFRQLGFFSKPFGDHFLPRDIILGYLAKNSPKPVYFCF